MLSEGTKDFIEKEWIGAGRPHNIICSQCLKPGNLSLCSTCCRSYHYVCLASPPSVEGAASWSCPSCQERQTALQFEYDRLSDPTNVSMVDRNRDTSAGDIFAATFSDPAYTMAKRFLSNHGLANNNAITADFLNDLQQLIVKSELASHKDTELLKLRRENSRLMTEISRNRAGSEPHQSHQFHQSQHSPVYNSQQGASAPPSYPPSKAEISKLDVSDKSWDRIISEAF
ncbi:hypothetical protein EYB25_002576 [Talaromyces marneffei]|nr:uncharacterized protein EYB26_002594 [Talaromyces marneffei]KAE8554038.1 hypothetical protein EYB25_002576 [Talaromyces marneffei]QGA14938.1 hypothetical protein EYB26_002594 [Talaromyces marneffei]